MRTLMVVAFVAALSLASATVAVAQDVACGAVLGFKAATATMPGSLTLGLGQPGSATMTSVMVVIPRGTVVTVSGFECVTTTMTGTERTLVSVIRPGAPGFVSPASLTQTTSTTLTASGTGTTATPTSAQGSTGVPTTTTTSARTTTPIRTLPNTSTQP